MIKNFISRLVLIIASGFLLNCASSELATKSDYETSRQLFRRNKFDLTKENLPKSELGSFVTESEKMWIDLHDGQPDALKLQGLADQLDERKTNYLSRETKRFFYKETEDGYFPAEHEVIAFHILLAMAYAKNENREAACVETRRAGEYLEGEYDDRRAEHGGEFDDPALRLWLSGLWVYCGEWDHAQVDLRVANVLLGEKTELNSVLAMNKAPAVYHVFMKGDGPEPRWTGSIDSKKAPVLSELKFEFTETAPAEFRVVDEKGKERNITAVANTANWYSRHVDRNTQMREIFDKSEYMLDSAGAAAQSVAHKGMASVVSGVLVGTGVILGGALIAGSIYALAQMKDGCSEGCGQIIGALFLAGLGVMDSMYKAGKKVFLNETEAADEDLRKVVDFSERYRYVRFLPNQIGLAVGEANEELLENVSEVRSRPKPFLVLKSKDLKSEVRFYHWSNY